MTFKSRWIPGLLALLVVLSLAPAAFAQVSITITTDPSTNEIGTNHHAQTASPGVAGDGVLISGSLVANSNLSTTSLVFSYPAPITSGSGFNSPLAGRSIPSLPTGDPIRVEGASGVFSAVSSPSVSTTGGTVSVALPACGSSPPLSFTGCNTTSGGFQAATINSQGGLFRLVGVRIDANGKTGAQTMTASLSNVTNNYLLATTGAQNVISNVVANGVSTALGTRTGSTTSAANSGAASVFTNRTAAKAQGSFLLTEGCANCWRTNTQNSNSTSGITTNGNSTQIRLTFTGMPTGVTLSLSIQTSSTITATINNTSVTSTANTSNVDFTGTSLGSTEQVEVDITNITTSGSTAALSPGSITVTATMFPVDTSAFGTADGNGNVTVSDSGGYPRFTDLETAPISVVNIVPANTTMLIPYALVSGPIDTGIALANTTVDAFAAGGAIPSNGTIKFDFFPNATTGSGAGAPFSVTTSATNRVNNLDSNGNLVAGSLLAVNTSQLLPLAGVTSGSFQGYIFITANFLNAHGMAFMSDYKTFFLSEPILILAPPAASPRSGPTHAAIGAGAEVLLF